MSERDDLPQRSTVLRPGIRTFKPRRSRITRRESAALIAQAEFCLPYTGSQLDIAATWGGDVPVVIEIGFGSGAATASMAAAAPTTGILAIDIHTPGVGDLLHLIGADELRNVRVMEADALAVLEFMIPPHSLAGVRSFFPDPWPKPRHHKRRLVQPATASLVAARLASGGYWHLATDWAEYATQMQAVFDADARWHGGVIDRPVGRPVTHYERRALREGRSITDLRYEYRPPP